MSRVTLVVRPWAGSRQVSTEEADGLLVEAVMVDGHEVSRPQITLMPDDFATIAIASPPENLRALFADPGKYLTNDDAGLVLPITAISVRITPPDA